MVIPNACVLSTVDEQGFPDGRVVLLKEILDEGLVFYTNRASAKGRALGAHPKGGLTFYWESLGRQVRVVGTVAPVPDAVSDAYFESRPRGSRIGAWASDQSAPLESREALERRVRELESRYADGDVPRPPHWGGYVLTPVRIEFWQDGPFRLHDRFLFQRDGHGEWGAERLNP